MRCRLFFPNFGQAVRGLGKAPGLSAIAVASMAIGIGTNVTVYSVVRELILDDMSARQADRLVRLGSTVTAARYRDLRRSGVLQDLACNAGLSTAEWDAGGHRELVWKITTSANFFDVLGVGGSMGRLYSQTDEGLPGRGSQPRVLAETSALRSPRDWGPAPDTRQALHHRGGVATPLSQHYAPRHCTGSVFVERSGDGRVPAVRAGYATD
ncbi:MAG: hypothetical protein WDO73_10440 [Ignavibacteriota bacterium]